MNSQRWMSQNFFTFFLTWGIFLPYWSGFLVSVKEISLMDVGLIMSLGLIARGFSTLFFFPVISKKWSSKHVLMLLAYGALIMAALYIPAQSFMQLLIVTIFFNFFYPALMPALDSVAGVLVQNNGLHYGKARQYGSIGFIVMVLIISMITAMTGDDMLLYFLLLGLVVLAILTSVKAPEVLEAKPHVDNGDKKSTNNSLFKTKNFLVVMIIAVILQGSHAAYYNYGYIYLQDLAVPKYYIGIIINIGVIFEIIFFSQADRFFRNWSVGKILMLATIGTVLRWLVVGLVPNVWVFSATQILHAFSFAMAHYAVILFFTKNLRREQLPTAQGMYSAFALSWSTAALTMLSGSLYELKPGYAFIAMAVVSVPALLLCLKLMKKNV